MPDSQEMLLENGDLEKWGAAREDPDPTGRNLQKSGERSSSFPE